MSMCRVFSWNANEIDNHKVRQRGRKKKKIQKKLWNNSKQNNNKCFPWVTAVMVLSLSGCHSPPHLPRMLTNSVLVSVPAVGVSQILIWSYSCVFLPPMSTAIRASVFLLWELSMTFHIFHWHRVCLVDHVDLISSLYSWWEGFGASSLAILPLGFNCGFISTSTCGLSTGV